MRALTVVTFVAVAVPLNAQYGGMPPKERSSAVKGDLPAIKCGVCEALMDVVHAKVASMRADAPFGKVHEDDISELIEEACDPQKVSGRWITEFDLEEEGGYLELKKPGGMSHCKEECETIAKSCASLVGEELDVEELVVALWKNELGAEGLRKRGCKEWSERCNGKRARASKDRKDYAFEEKSKKDFDMEELMESLGGMGGMGGMGGPGMEMYTPDQLSAMQEMMGDNDPYGDMGGYGMGGDRGFGMGGDRGFGMGGDRGFGMEGDGGFGMGGDGGFGEF